jgi:hypothetical protein
MSSCTSGIGISILGSTGFGVGIAIFGFLIETRNKWSISLFDFFLFFAMN